MRINRGWRHNRVNYIPERLPGWINKEKVFSELWEKENEPIPWLNHGFGVLQDLFIDSCNPWSMWERKVVKRITKRERMIVATVVQWLGTNCGWCFLEQALNKCGYKLVKMESD